MTREELFAHPNDLLAVMGEKTGGSGLKLFISIDAVIVLCGTCVLRRPL